MSKARLVWIGVSMVAGIALAASFGWMGDSATVAAFSADDSCPAEQVTLSGVGRRGYTRAQGCGRSCVYGVTLGSVSKAGPCD